MSTRRQRRKGGTWKGVLIAAALLTAAACDDPVTPAGVAETYVLTEVAGDPLPAVLRETDHDRFRVTHDLLVLRTDRTGYRTTSGVAEAVGVDGPVEPFEWEMPLTYAAIADLIVIEYDCPDNASCIAPPHLIARRVSGGLRAESRLGERDPLVYAPATLLMDGG